MSLWQCLCWVIRRHRYKLRPFTPAQVSTSVKECWSSSCLWMGICTCQWCTASLLCPKVVSTSLKHLANISHWASFFFSINLLCLQCGGSFQIHLRLSLHSVTFIGTHSWLAKITQIRPIPALASHNSQPERRYSSVLSACRPSLLPSSLPSQRALAASAKLPGGLEWSSRIMTYTNAVLRFMVVGLQAWFFFCDRNRQQNMPI